MTSFFTFRQRIGKLDWKTVSSVSTEDIVLNLKISELQSVLDEVTFCEFTAIDVKTNTVESITKLIQLMQLISEYLLHCQEAQFKIMKELNAKGTKLKSNYEKLKLENVSLKEDCKIYQRQLAMLRKTLSKGLGGEEDNESNNKRLLAEEWRLAQLAIDRQNNNALAPEIVESILQHERESRVYMLSILDEQRKTFAGEMSKMMESVRNASNNSNKTPTEEWMESIKNQLESACENAIKKATEQAPVRRTSVSTSVDVRRSINQQPSSNNKEADNVGLLLREAALETKEAELNDLERDLVKREQQLKHREIAMARELEVEREKLRKALRNAATTSNDSSAGSKATAVQSRMIIRCKSLAAKTILSRIHQVLWRKKLRCFRLWTRQMQDLRELETMREHGRILKTTALKPSRGEEELRGQLEVERSRVLAGQARCAQLAKEMESLQGQLARSQESSGDNARRDADFQSSLQSEKDRAVVANAKYNALLSRSEKEKKELLEKLQKTEELLAKEASKIRPTPALAAPAAAAPPVKVNSGTSTGSSVATSTANLQPSSLLLSQFSAQYMVESGDELLLRAQQRVADRKNSQMTLEAKAMAMLAQEINGKLYATQ